MGFFDKLLSACGQTDCMRATRILLKKATRGETGCFAELADGYFHLLTEYLYLCNFDQREAEQRTCEILREGWLRLPFMKSLGDWETFLARSLMAVEPDPERSTEGRRPSALIALDPRAKFALVAFDLENWPYKSLSLALGMKERELSRLIFQGRCRLIEMDVAAQTRKVRHFLEQVSADLDGQSTPRQRQAVHRKMCHSAEAKTFKAQWLDYRCHLIEMRQQVRLQPEKQQAILEQLCTRLSSEEMLRPPFFLKIRRLFSATPPAPPILSRQS